MCHHSPISRGVTRNFCLGDDKLSHDIFPFWGYLFLDVISLHFCASFHLLNISLTARGCQGQNLFWGDEGAMSHKLKLGGTIIVMLCRLITGDTSS